jgi:hypothetical protein
MKHLRKSFLTLLALTLFGGAGAWAQQGPTNVTQFTTDLIASWATDNHPITLADLQDLGFEATDYATAAAWTGAPQDGSCYLFYAISGSNIAYVYFTAGSENDHDNGAFVKSDLYNDVVNGWKYFYTGSPEPAEIELTKTGANQWTLAQTPDYDLDLNVVYYGQYTLDSIPTTWQVLVNGEAATVTPYTEGNTTLGHLTINETDNVELIPPADVKPNVKNVKLVVPLLSINVSGHTIYYLPGETWAQAAQNHPENYIDDWEHWGTDSGYVTYGEQYLQVKSGEVWVQASPDAPISANGEYRLEWF